MAYGRGSHMDICVHQKNNSKNQNVSFGDTGLASTSEVPIYTHFN